MPIKVQCPNADCGKVAVVKDQLAFLLPVFVDLCKAGFVVVAPGRIGERTGTRRLAALGEREGKRDQCCEEREPAQPPRLKGARKPMTRSARPFSRVRAHTAFRFRIGPDHPPLCPNRRRIG